MQGKTQTFYVWPAGEISSQTRPPCAVESVTPLGPLSRACTGQGVNSLIPHRFIPLPIHGGKRKCHLKFSEESSLQILIHINSVPPIQYWSFSSYISSIVNRDLALPATVSLCRVLTAVYRLSNIPTQIKFWEIIIIQFVCSSRKEISQNIFKSRSYVWSKDHPVLIYVRSSGHLSLSDDALTTAGEKNLCLSINP